MSCSSRVPALPPPLRAFSAGLAVSVLAAALAAAQEAKPGDAANPYGRKYPPRVYNAARLEGALPLIDGRLDDKAWQEQGDWSGDYTQQAPTEGAAPTKPTDLKILYDDENLYFAIRAWDDPDKIHRYPGRRDDFGGYAVDVVGICFDSYNDKRTGFEFDLTAGGGKIDLLLGNGETEWDTTWDAVWDGKVSHDAHGWYAEFRVPLNQLRFGPQDEQVWGMHAWRWLARNQEESQWQLIPRQNTGRMYQLGELRGIRGLPRSRHVELLPHAVGKAASGPSIPGTGGADGSGSVGLDAKIGLSTNFTLDATVNPDFGQVEADPSVVNLTAYENFFEEKRPFFLEGRKILDFTVEENDQLFHSRRIGQSSSFAPPLEEGETARLPESTTILGAAKVTGKTNNGLSVAVLQGVTQKETASISSPRGSRAPVVEPFGSFTVGRVQKDFAKGNTILGGMFTSTHRWTTNHALAGVPTQAWSGGLDFTHFFADRSFMVEARGLLSRVEGEPEAIRALETNAVHYFQRPGARHLGVDEDATSLSGHGGALRVGTSGQSRLKLTDRFHWYSPGLDLNDVGYLRQADLRENQMLVGWSETSPKGPFRAYTLELSRRDQWDFGGLATKRVSSLQAGGTFENKWNVQGALSFEQVTDTRALRGGPALRWHDYFDASLEAGTDGSRRASLTAQAEHAWSVDDDSRSTELTGQLKVRASNRLSFSGQASYETKTDNLQYVATTVAGSEPRFVLGRIAQDTWSFTLRMNLALTPNLTLQYYGSPFIGTGQYTDFKRATDTLAARYEDRFHAYGRGEIARTADGHYRVDEASGGRYSFANPDFSFRQFRSNLVARWEWKPGSSLYVIWSQGRTNEVPYWEDSFRRNWSSLGSTRPDDVFLIKISYWLSP